MSDDEIKICNNCKHYIRSTAFPKRGICFLFNISSNTGEKNTCSEWINETPY